MRQQLKLNMPRIALLQKRFIDPPTITLHLAQNSFLVHLLKQMKSILTDENKIVHIKVDNTLVV